LASETETAIIRTSTATDSTIRGTPYVLFAILAGQKIHVNVPLNR
jgi:hypothetical protein